MITHKIFATLLGSITDMARAKMIEHLQSLPDHTISFIPSDVDTSDPDFDLDDISDHIWDYDIAQGRKRAIGVTLCGTRLYVDEIDGDSSDITDPYMRDFLEITMADELFLADMVLAKVPQQISQIEYLIIPDDKCPNCTNGNRANGDMCITCSGIGTLNNPNRYYSLINKKSKMKNSKLPIDFDKAKQAGKIIRALAHPLRLDILKFIDGKKSTPMRDIYQSLELDQSIASQHLKILRDADMVTFRREGKQKHYAVNYERVEHVNNCIMLLPKSETL
jgi:DNA-binding transcriptional ArsR family regulator